MADYTQDFTPFYEDDTYAQKTGNTTDLHAYFMTQFNMEVENKSKASKQKTNDLFKTGNEESFDLETLEGWNHSSDKNGYAFEIIDAVIENKNVNEENIKDVLLDLDAIDSQHKHTVNTAAKATESKPVNDNHDYIDDESLLDELCREDTDGRLTPDIFNDEYLSSISNDKNHLPSMETAFSKRYFNYNNQNEQANNNVTLNSETVVENLECYSYPNNILHNLNSESYYILPDTPTSCTEFSYERAERKVSLSESVESDVQSSFYDENSETLDEEELFVNLDDFGFVDFDAQNVVSGNDGFETVKERKGDKDKMQGERCCLWEHCYEKYPNQSTLVEHIERSHVNTYKGDEFSCLWRDCARARRPFNARYKLLIHMRVHSGHKPNRCHHPGCGKAFSRLENLKIHVRSHTGERPYACPAPHCRKAFSNSSDRAKHQRTHFNARPYACGAIGCGKRYTDPSSLRKHVKSHPHAPSVPRTCTPPSRPPRKMEVGGKIRSPVKLATLRCIRDKLTTGPRFQRL